MLSRYSADLAPCFHHWSVPSEQTKTSGAPRGLQASTAKRGSVAAESTATHAERESRRGWANPTSGTVWLSPKEKSLRSRSGRYPQARSGPLMESGFSETAAMVWFLLACRSDAHTAATRAEQCTEHLRHILQCSGDYRTLGCYSIAANRLLSCCVSSVNTRSRLRPGALREGGYGPARNAPPDGRE